MNLQTSIDPMTCFEERDKIKMAIENLKSVGFAPQAEILAKLVELERLCLENEESYNASPIYNRFKKDKKYSTELQNCIETAVEHLLNPANDNYAAPGMLLGKIQSGKTRAFVGIIGLAFDKGFDHCIVFTKGTNALTNQTVARLQSEFDHFIDNPELANSSQVQVYDIISLNSLTRHQINSEKNIIVCKKEINNINNLNELFENYPLLKEKRILIIDDEADFASFGFGKKDGETWQNKIAGSIDLLRKSLSNYRYLQVTATPYSLYLQPQGDIELTNERISPIRPEFTVLVPVHDRYIGGEHYFEAAQNSNSMYSNLFVRVSPEEFQVLSRIDKRYVSNIMTTPNLSSFRKSICGYLVACAIRKIQESKNGKHYKSSCLIHTEITKQYHSWQKMLIQTFLQNLTLIAVTDEVKFKEYIESAYSDFAESNQKGNAENLISIEMPTFSAVVIEVEQALKNEDICVTEVNSKEDVGALLDKNGQLKLQSGYNIFIGGYVLDRGLTIENLIAFFYGRNPNSFQMDTVLQHARIYGARSKEDMAVSRLYTTTRIYNSMKKMYEFDNELRAAFERKVKDPDADDSAVFICYDPTEGIKPCSPQKILMTETEALRPDKRILPVGFQTGCASKIKKIIEEIDFLIENSPNYKKNEIFDLDKNTALNIVKLISSTYIYNRPIDTNIGLDWDYENFMGIIRRLSGDHQTIKCLHRTERDMSRIRKNGAFVDAPDDGNTDTTIARRAAKEVPSLILIKQQGREKQGWRDTPFYWPVLICPENTVSSI